MGKIYATKKARRTKSVHTEINEPSRLRVCFSLVRSLQKKGV